jgi:hypothetical protein
MAFVQTKFGLLPPDAAKEALFLDGGINRDVSRCDVRLLKCGCYKTSIFWTKDCHDFEDDRISITLDDRISITLDVNSECKMHNKQLKTITFSSEK